MTHCPNVLDVADNETKRTAVVGDALTRCARRLPGISRGRRGAHVGRAQDQQTKRPLCLDLCLERRHRRVVRVVISHRVAVVPLAGRRRRSSISSACEIAAVQNAD